MLGSQYVELRKRHMTLLREARRRVIVGALPKKDSDLEVLLSAYGSEHKGQPLSEAESIARREYEAAVELERSSFKSLPAMSIDWVLDVPHIFQEALGRMLQRHFSNPQAITLYNALIAMELLVAPTPRAKPLVDLARSEMRRLADLADFFVDA
jgi:hypothetical protein